jgi:hypothetical protein
MSRGHHPPLRDVTADTENNASSNAPCWTVFTEQRVDQIRYNINFIFTKFVNALIFRIATLNDL